MVASLATPLRRRRGACGAAALLPWLAILATPFAVMAVMLDNLRRTLHTFHWTDEANYHFPVVKAFAQQLPLPDFSSYDSATTPLFHWVFAAFAALSGAQLPALRTLNVLVSFAAVAVLFAALVLDRGWRPRDAVLAAGAFALSPYFFGASFLLLTDNMSWLFAICALWMLARARAQPMSMTPWLLCCVALALAMMTRQTHIWLVVCLAATLVVVPVDARKRVAVLVALGLCLLPVAGLALMWGGLVPPPFQAGHAARIVHDPGVRINLKALMFAVSLIGLYGALLRPRMFLQLRDRRIAARAAGFAAVVLVILWLHPLERIEGRDNGFVWSISTGLHTLAGTSLLYWLLLPVGTTAIAAAWAEDRNSLTSLGLGSILVLAAISTDYVFQKYFDPLVPLLLTVGHPQATPLARVDRAGYLLVLCGGVAYVLAQAARR